MKNDNADKAVKATKAKIASAHQATPGKYVDFPRHEYLEPFEVTESRHAINAITILEKWLSRQEPVYPMRGWKATVADIRSYARKIRDENERGV